MLFKNTSIISGSFPSGGIPGRRRRPRVNYLYDLNDLRIHRTMEDQEDIKLYFRELQENGIEAHRRILDRASELLL